MSFVFAYPTSSTSCDMFVGTDPLCAANTMSACSLVYSTVSRPMSPRRVPLRGSEEAAGERTVVVRAAASSDIPDM